MGLWKEFEGINENEGHPQILFTSSISSASTNKKKILGERNSDDTNFETTPKEKLIMGFERVEVHPQESYPFPLKANPISASSRSVPYDPVNNYTSPRPAFLRYNPNLRKEILLRMRDEEASVADYGPLKDQEKFIEEDSASVSSTSSKLSFQEKETQEDAEDEGDAEVDDAEEEEVSKGNPLCIRMVWKLLLLFGVFLFSHHFFFPMNSSSSPVQEKFSTSENFLRPNLLRVHMGLSDVCLDTGEEMCGIEIPSTSSDLVVSDEFVMAHVGDSIEDESLMYGEVTGDSDSGENELSDGTEFVAERCEEEESDFGEDETEQVSFHEFFEQKGISGIENLSGVTQTASESVEAFDDQFDTDESGTDLTEEVYYEERAALAESLVASQFQSVSSSLQDDQAIEEFELPTVHETSSRWKLGLEFTSKDVQLLFISLSLMIGILVGLLKYFARSHKKPAQVSSPSPTFLPTGRSVVERRTSEESPSNYYSGEQKESLFASPMLLPSVPVMEEMRTEAKDSNVNRRSSNYSIEELKGFYATRAPTVELLGEFSIVDALYSKSAPGQRLKSEGFEEPEFPKAQRTKGTGEAQVSHSEVKKTGKAKSSPLSSTKGPVENGEEKRAVAVTPLRRSSRLRNRGMSPTP